MSRALLGQLELVMKDDGASFEHGLLNVRPFHFEPVFAPYEQIQRLFVPLEQQDGSQPGENECEYDAQKTRTEPG